MNDLGFSKAAFFSFVLAAAAALGILLLYKDCSTDRQLWSQCCIHGLTVRAYFRIPITSPVHFYDFVFWKEEESRQKRTDGKDVPHT